MNRIFKVLWNQALAAFVAVSEIAGHTKKGTRSIKTQTHGDTLLTSPKLSWGAMLAQSALFLLSLVSMNAYADVKWDSVKALDREGKPTLKQITLANGALGNGTLANPSSPDYGIRLPSAGGTGYTYNYVLSTFIADANQTLSAFGQTYAGDIDTVMILYRGVYDPYNPASGGFNPADPGANAIVGNDDTYSSVHMTTLTAANNNVAPTPPSDAPRQPGFTGPLNANEIYCRTTSYCPQIEKNSEQLVKGESYTLFISVYSIGYNAAFADALASSGFTFYSTATGQFISNMSPIDTDKPFYVFSELGTKVRREFKGGVLRVDTPNATDSNGFNIHSDATFAGSTIDPNGNTATFSGVLYDRVAGQAGSLRIANTADTAGAGGTVIFTGDNTYTGSTTVGANTTLQLGNGGTSGSVASSQINLSSYGTLIVNRSDNTAYTGTLTGEYMSQFTKDGTGRLSLTNASSTLGAVTVKAGELVFSMQSTFHALRDYTTDANAHTTLATSDTYLKVHGTLTQKAGSTLNITVSDTGPTPPRIQAKEAILENSTLNISGFTADYRNLSAGDLAFHDVTVVKTDPTQLSGTFGNITAGGSTATVDQIDYLTTRSIQTNDTYVLGVGLSWYANRYAQTLNAQGITPKNATGDFTLTNANEHFLLNAALHNEPGNTDPAHLWDGKSLTKKGDGTLQLAAQNTYTGQTTVEGGKLTLTGEGTLAQSSAVNLAAGTTVDISAITATTTTLQNLSGDTGSALILGNKNITLRNEANAYSTGTSQFAGLISGTGGLTKTGAGHLTLLANNTYTGTTLVQAGTLELGDGGVNGSIPFSTGIRVEDNATLIVNRSDNRTYAGDFSGAAASTLIKRGVGTLRFGEAATLGNLIVENGTLELAHGTATSENIHVQGDLTTKNGARTRILQTLGYLQIDGALKQEDGSTLGIHIDSRPGVEYADVRANTVNIGNNATLNLIGFSSQGTPSSTSSLGTYEVTVIHSANPGNMTGTFSQVTVGGAQSGTDYLYIDAASSGIKNNQDYVVKFGLSWYAGLNTSAPITAHGDFTLTNANESFAIDAILENQAANAGWDGKSLTKKGLGTLALTQQNTYTGSTSVEAGTLALRDAGSIAQSGAVNLAAGTTLDVSAITATETALKNLSAAATSTLNITGKTLTLINEANDYSSGTTAVNAIVTGDASAHLIKDGSGTLTLGAQNTYRGATWLKAGTLNLATDNAISQSESLSLAAGTRLDLLGTTQTINYLSSYASNSVIAMNGGTLTAHNANATEYTVFAGSFSDGTGSLIKTGAGELWLTNAGSQIGNISAREGKLQLTHDGILQVNGDYETRSGATTGLYIAQSRLNVAGTFTQQADSTLEIAVGNANGTSPDIVAKKAVLDGKLTLTGWTASLLPTTASQVNNSRYRLIETTEGITGNFSNSGIIGTPPLPHLVSYGLVNGNNYDIGFRLAWTDGGTSLSTGNFNLPTADSSFEVDQALTNQSNSFTNGWDGATLDKKGQGTLILSENNTYTGATTIYEGKLTLKGNGAIADSQALNLSASAATLDISAINSDTATIQNLNGVQNTQVILGDKNLSVTTTNRQDGSPQVFAGDIAGAGQFIKTGAGTQVLAGNLGYTGDTHINAGTLAIDGSLGNGRGQLTSNIIGDKNTAVSLVLQNKAVLTGSIDPVSLAIESESRWNMTGDSQVDALNMTQDSVLAMQAPSSPNGPFKTLQIGGNFSGDATTTVMMTTNIAEGTGDLIQAQSTSGNTKLYITNLGGQPASASQTLKVVDVLTPAQSLAAFSLANPAGGVDAGAYRYSLMAGSSVKGGDLGDWYLVNRNAALSSTALGMIGIVSGEKNAMMSALGDLNLRFGELRHDQGYQGDLWMRSWQGEYIIRPDGGQRTEQRISGIDVGVDRRFNIEGGRAYVGGLIGWVGSDSNINTVGNGKLTSVNLGAYATLAWDSGFYSDTVLRHFWFNRDYQFITNGQHENSSTKNRGWAFNTEVGKTIDLNPQWFVEPQLALNFMSQSDANFTTSLGNELSTYSSDQLISRVSLRVGHRFGETANTANAAPRRSGTQVYSRLDWQKTLTGEDRAKVNDTSFNTGKGAEAWRLMVGVQSQQENQQLHLELSTGLGNNEVQERWRINAGARWAF